MLGLRVEQMFVRYKTLGSMFGLDREAGERIDI